MGVEAFFWADLWKRRHINLWLMIPLYALGLIFHFLVDTIFSCLFCCFIRGAAICLVCLHSKISLIESHIFRFFVQNHYLSESITCPGQSKVILDAEFPSHFPVSIVMVFASRMLLYSYL